MILAALCACGGGKSPSTDGGVDPSIDAGDPPVEDATPDGPPPCVPTRACDSPALACGTFDDGCGMPLACGECPGELTCGAQQPNVCGVPDGERTCNAAGWCWQHPLPFGMNFTGVWGAAANDVWATGEGGTLWHYDGTTWAPRASGTALDLTSIWGTAANNIYVVGQDGFIRRWNGTALVLVPGAPAELYANVVRGRSATDVWIAGSFGPNDRDMWRFDGVTWTGYNTNEFFGISTVLPFSATSAWAMGFSDTAVAWNGVTTTPLEGAPSSVYALHGTANDVWAGGEKLSRWNGTAWSTIPNITSIRALEGTATDLWAGGDKGLHHWNGTAWGALVATAAPIAALWPAATGGWAVGASGGLYEKTNATWTQRTGFGVTSALRVVLPIDDHDVWAFGGGLAFRWRDGLVEHYAVGESVDHAWASGPNDVWATGSGNELVHWNGERWTKVATGIADLPELEAVWGTGPTNVYAVTHATNTFEPSDAFVIRFDGTAWTKVATIRETGSIGFGADLTAISGTGPSDIWVGGDEGLLYHWNGTAWTKQASPSTGDIDDLWTSSNGTVWMAGSSVYRRSGANWVPATNAPPGTHRIAGTTDSDVWVTDYATRVVSRWNGTSWTTENPGIGQWIRDVGATPRSVFVVGESGGIVRKSR